MKTKQNSVKFLRHKQKNENNTHRFQKLNNNHRHLWILISKIHFVAANLRISFDVIVNVIGLQYLV